ncbi:hypothetical protein [Nocardia rhizosphaerae]|uniref:Uncharacterized protein n=1 Tax=Nocardia rhizosphaerae TaxID=1691571 RepID=A0ABV8L802_9NOCA
MSSSHTSHANRRGRLRWLLVAFAIVVAALLAQGSACHDAVAARHGDTVCTTAAPTAQPSGFTTSLDEFAWPASDADPAIDMLGLCVALLFAVLAVAALLGLPTVNAIVPRTAGRARVAAPPRLPTAPSLAMLCVLRT